jgi:sugar/nucleoside kinase (ribokinase family)
VPDFDLLVLGDCNPDLAGVLNDWSHERALVLGCACGALSTRAAGGAVAQPALAEALQLLERAA